jgi:hypothetical protein
MPGVSPGAGGISREDIGLGVSEDQHYVYPGVRGPLLLPSDYIRKYFLYRGFIINFPFNVRACICDRNFSLQL